MNNLDKIEINPKIMVGKPIIKGTRVAVDVILRQLALGQTSDDILDNYPNLKKQDIQAAIAYAAQLIEENLIYPTHYEKNKGRVKVVT